MRNFKSNSEWRIFAINSLFSVFESKISNAVFSFDQKSEPSN